MKDIQKTEPEHQIPIQKVGIKNLKLPVYVLQKDYSSQHTIADIDIFVDLDKDVKGIHMSRLIEGAHNSIKNRLSSETIREVSRQILKENEALRTEIIFKFPYFISKIAPVSEKVGMIHCNVKMKFITNEIRDLDFDTYFKESSFLSVELYTTSLCPCSKEISKYGAHNQRSKVKITGEHFQNSEDHFWIEDLIDIIEDCSSSDMYSILKRPDEQFVTEKAYENPNFVEDSAREIYFKVLKENKFSEFSVEVTNEESIHLHDAYAKISYP